MDGFCWAREERRLPSRCTLFFLLVAGSAGTAATGCAERVLTIGQADLINTAMYRDPERNDPLELSIVCVSAKDLKRPENKRLAPDSGITSEEWYRRRPRPGDHADRPDRGDRFYLPADQIFLLTDTLESYGTPLGACLRGAEIDRQQETKIRFPFGGPLHSDDSVIYVFPKFIGPDGKVLPVRPAQFHPPGAYTRDLAIQIGVNEAEFPGYYGQYIRIDEEKCRRRLHGRR